MRLGLIGRANRKGLGTMTAEFHRHMRPDRTLVVRTAGDEGGYDFGGERVIDFDGSLPEEAMHWLLDGCDVLYTAETPYDYRVLDMARERGVRTLLHGMWEFLAYRRQPDLPRPTMFLSPSAWHLREWPAPCSYLAVPVATDRLEQREPGPITTIVHPGGSPARGDRNGTQALLDALPFVRERVTVLLRSWTPPRARRSSHRAVSLRYERPTHDYWDATAGADAVVLPRRYGGLCLPLQEASARGLAVVATEREREAGYPHAAVVPVARRRPMGLPCGPVERADIDPRKLAAAIDRLVTDQEMSDGLAARSAAWTAAHSWEALLPAYERLLRR